MGNTRRNKQAVAILAEIDGHLPTDIRAMRHWATLKDETPAGLGRLKLRAHGRLFDRMRALGFLVRRQDLRGKPSGATDDPGGYIISFIDSFFPAKHRFKLISKILADGMRDELVHGFGGRVLAEWSNLVSPQRSRAPSKRCLRPAAANATMTRSG